MEAQLKELKYVARLQPAAATVSDIEDFQRHIPFPLSSTFAVYCRTQNGGVPSSKNNQFIPRKHHAPYWKMARQRFINEAGEFDVNQLYGLTSEERHSLFHWSENAKRVWRLPEIYWVVASDITGAKLVSELTTDNDAVYFWEPYIEPHLFQVTDSLLEFYNSLEQEVVEE
jgi:hypothetical protein